MEKKSLSELKEVLYSGVVADILDSMGVRRNSLEYGLRPLDNDYKVLGRAFTVLAADVYEISRGAIQIGAGERRQGWP